MGLVLATACEHNAVSMYLSQVHNAVLSVTVYVIVLHGHVVRLLNLCRYGCIFWPQSQHILLSHSTYRVNSFEGM